MTYLFLLSKENLSLSQQEVLALTNVDSYMLDNNLLVVKTSKLSLNFLGKRLAYTKKIFKLLFSSTLSEIEQQFSHYPWNNVYQKSFSLRVERIYKGKKFNESKLSHIVWKKLHKPKTDLKSARTQIVLFITSKKAYCCLLKKDISYNFDERKSHKRPEHHPTSLHPRLAKALINLTGIKKGILVDPFCGSGGILIEAGLMHLLPTGYDIDSQMIRRSEKNLSFYDIKNYQLYHKNALTLKNTNYVVSDLPYGRNTKQKNLLPLYDRFLKHLKKVLKKKAVLVFPKQKKSYRFLIKKNNIVIENSFTLYLHKTLSKEIFVIS